MTQRQEDDRSEIVVHTNPRILLVVESNPHTLLFGLAVLLLIPDPDIVDSWEINDVLL